MNATTPDQVWKVGQLADQTGLTVRTLHHYDHIGLVRASQYFDETQLTELAERRAQVGEQAVADVEAGWRELLPRVAAAVQAGMDPAAAQAQAMAAQWMTLLEAFHGGDEDLRAGLYRMQAENAERIEHEHGGPTAAQLEFIQRANAAANEVKDWIAHRRDDDGELIGFLAPAGEGFIAMTVFGSPLAETADRLQAESVLDSCGLSYLADRWRLRLDDGRSIEVEIVEASPERAVVKNVDFASGLDHGHRMALTAPVGDRLLRDQ